MPWDYPYEDCETLCRGCHAELHGKICPSTGWEYLGEDDLGELSGQCEACGTEIRYVFWIHHPNWEPMGVGTICCDHMTESRAASDHMESLLRFRSRLDRFVKSSRWKATGGIQSIRQKRIAVEVIPEKTGFKVRMNGIPGKRVFPTVEAAKVRAFESIEDGTAFKALVKHGGISER